MQRSVKKDKKKMKGREARAGIKKDGKRKTINICFDVFLSPSDFWSTRGRYNKGGKIMLLL
jgi:hypothetical protein